MKNKRSFIDTLANIPEWILILVLVYFVSMVIIPFVTGGFDWEYLQSVWHDWQSINAGILAFLAAVIGLHLTTLRAEKERQQNFFAAKSSLPEALTEFYSYFKSSAKIYREAWNLLTHHPSDPLVKFETYLPHAPDLPILYRDVFKDCIKYADPDSDVSRYLAEILIRLQVHHSRLTHLKISETTYSFYNFHEEFHCLATLSILIDRLLEYSRDTELLNSDILQWEEFNSKYRYLCIDIYQFSINGSTLKDYYYRHPSLNKIF